MGTVIHVPCLIPAVWALLLVWGGYRHRGVSLIRTSVAFSFWHIPRWPFYLFLKKAFFLKIAMHYSQHRCQSDPWWHQLTKMQAPSQNQPAPSHGSEAACNERWPCKQMLGDHKLSHIFGCCLNLISILSGLNYFLFIQVRVHSST